MQLRPSGRAGPAAVRLTAFQRYYSDEAWTWEVMSLTRARIISAPPTLGARMMDEIEAILRRARSSEDTARDVIDMRARLKAAKPASGPWDVKTIVGGLTDIAFIGQFLTLTSAARIGPPPQDTVSALMMFAENGELPHDSSALLIKAQTVFDAVLQLGRVASGGVFDPASAGRALKQRMAAVCGAASLEQAEEMLKKSQSEVVRLFSEVLHTPPVNDDEARNESPVKGAAATRT